MGPRPVGLFVVFIFSLDQPLTRSGAGVTGMSRRGSGEVTGTGATLRLG